jgi:hypothetical protein
MEFSDFYLGREFYYLDYEDEIRSDVIYGIKLKENTNDDYSNRHKKKLEDLKIDDYYVYGYFDKEHEVKGISFDREEIIEREKSVLLKKIQKQQERVDMLKAKYHL